MENFKLIGFANQFFTLWNVSIEYHYKPNFRGEHVLSGKTNKFEFIKNISKDIEKVKKLYPNLSIDYGLKGTKRFSFYEKIESEKEPLTKFKFGKYIGKTFEEVAENDFDYIIWVLNNGSRETVEALEQLPKCIEYKNKIEEETNRILESSSTVKDGDKIKVCFEKNARDNGYFGAECWGILVDNKKSTKLNLVVNFKNCKTKGFGKYSYIVVIVNDVEYKLKNNEIELVVSKAYEKTINFQNEAVQRIEVN